MILTLPIPEAKTYVFQTCDSAYSYANIQSEQEWKNKKRIDKDFGEWAKLYGGDRKDTLYRVFEFRWWKFWEYGTYLISDVYDYPILPSNCTLKEPPYYGRKDN
jgi:hypothetical protein